MWQWQWCCRLVAVERGWCLRRLCTCSLLSKHAFGVLHAPREKRTKRKCEGQRDKGLRCHTAGPHSSAQPLQHALQPRGRAQPGAIRSGGVCQPEACGKGFVLPSSHAPCFVTSASGRKGVPGSLLNGGPVSSEPSLLLGKKQRALFPALREYGASYNKCADLSTCGLQLLILGFPGHTV